MKEQFLKFISENKRKIIILFISLTLFTLSLLLINKTYAEEEAIKVNETLEEKQEETSKEVIVNKIFVDIKGAVKNPGVYELEEGKRVNDLINLAGGILKTANSRDINLSKKLSDEMVVIIYTNDEIASFKESKEEVKEECICETDLNEACIEEEYSNYFSKISEINKQSSVININNASLEELQTLPGIGLSKAEEIIKYRNDNKFETIEDIKKVSGIGESLFNKIKNFIITE